MLSLIQWTWVWASSRRWWQTWKPGVLQSMGLQISRHNWATEQQQFTELHFINTLSTATMFKYSRAKCWTTQYIRKACGFWSQTLWTWIWALPCINSLILRKLLNLFYFNIILCSNRDINSAYDMGVILKIEWVSKCKVHRIQSSALRILFKCL